jgi:hypothetical protein
MVGLRSITGHLARLAWVAIRSFASTLVLLSVAGAALAVVSAYFLWDRPAHALVAAAVALLEGVATGVILGGKRAVVMALAHGLGTLRLGRSIVRLVFERLLSVSEGQEAGEHGGRVVRGLERLPLAQAERFLRGAVQSVLGEAEEGGRLRRALRARLLGLVQTYTLARFREEEAAHGSINLLKVKEDLEGRIDDDLVKRVRGGLRVWTLLVLVGLPTAVAAQTYVALALMK